MDILDFINSYDTQIKDFEIVCDRASFKDNVIIMGAPLLLNQCVFDSMYIYPNKRMIVVHLTFNEYNIKNTKYVFNYKKRTEGGTEFMILTRI